MSEGPKWFAAKRFGYGAGLPISWQGWLVTILFMVVAIGAGIMFVERPPILAAILVPAAVLLCVITAKTTRDGWHWRWGRDD